MTVINGVEIGNISYIPNKVHQILATSHTKISNMLNLPVIMVISNPCKYFRRYILAHEFIQRMNKTPNIDLYIVELEYGNNPVFEVTEKNNPRHLQLHLPDTQPIWHKENMINMAVKHLLPVDWKMMAWIDADVEFESLTWVNDTITLLSDGNYDIVQLFSHAIDMDQNCDTMQIFSGFGYQYANNRKYGVAGINNYWHPGFAWACTRSAYDKMGGLYDTAILGSGDNHMALSWIGKCDNTTNNLSDGYKKSVRDYQERCYSSNIGFKIGYVPGVIRHFFHGSKKNRKYIERRKILIEHNFDPNIHLTRLSTNSKFDGLLVPVQGLCPNELLDDIMSYFKERNEDEYFTYTSVQLN